MIKAARTHEFQEHLSQTCTCFSDTDYIHTQYQFTLTQKILAMCQPNIRFADFH